ncbi:MAG: hypothetical protein V4581_14430 [Bacteroidota bacterium]
MLLTIAMQAAQFHDFREWRSQVIEGIYVAVIIALMIYANFFPCLNNFLP